MSTLIHLYARLAWRIPGFVHHLGWDNAGRQWHHKRLVCICQCGDQLTTWREWWRGYCEGLCDPEGK